MCSRLCGIRPTSSWSTAPAAAPCSRTTGTCSATRGGQAFAARVRDVSELLARSRPATGRRAADSTVAYDAPCHLQHAQRVHAAPLAVLARDSRAPAPAAPRLRPLLRQCRHLLHAPARRCPARCSTPRSAASPRPCRVRRCVATGNPGCLMQIGAGLHGGPAADPGGAPGGVAGLVVRGGAVCSKQ